jgi:hypothetical protein
MPEPTHYVVLHTQVGQSFKRGDVVSAEALREELALSPREAVPSEGIKAVSERAALEASEANFRRLLDGGAVRPATEEEARQSSLTLPDSPGPGGDRAMEARLALADRERQDLRRENDRLREELARKGDQPPGVMATTEIEPKERVELRRSLDDLQGKLAEASRERDEAVREREAARAEIEGLREYIRQHEEPPGEQGQARKRK